MDLRYADGARDYLHRLIARAILPHIGDIVAATHHHPMPGQKHVFRKRLGKRAVEFDHHLGDALLSRCDAPVVGGES